LATEAGQTPARGPRVNAKLQCAAKRARGVAADSRTHHLVVHHARAAAIVGAWGCARWLEGQLQHRWPCIQASPSARLIVTRPKLQPPLAVGAQHHFLLALRLYGRPDELHERVQDLQGHLRHAALPCPG
jgi:hypothetical protein